MSELKVFQLDSFLYVFVTWRDT